MTSFGISQKKIIKAIYFLGFIFAIHSALPAYINSAFVSTLTGEKIVGIIYMAGSVLTILFFLKVSKFLERFGNYKMMLVLSVAEMAILFGLSYFKNSFVLVSLFILSLVLVNIIAFNLDILLENYSANSSTGSIRGMYLSAVNTAWLISPMIVGLILTDGDYWKIYLISAIVLVPMIIMFFLNFKGFKDSPYRQIPFIKTIREMPKHQSTYKIVASNFLLQFFYAWMVIYSPIYLHDHIGFGWEKIGIIFTIMLLPFVIFEAPLGRLADKKWGEKEILSAGFIVLAISTVLLSFIGKSAVIWAIALFVTRAGASAIEIMNETYFFKKNSQRDSDIIRLFRMTRPIAYIIAPLIVSLLLVLLPFKYNFLVLGILMFWGLRYSLTLKDTK